MAAGPASASAESKAEEILQMIILDTDTLSIAQRPDSAAAITLRRRMAEVSPDEVVATTIITYEEQTRGWFAYLAKAHTAGNN